MPARRTMRTQIITSLVGLSTPVAARPYAGPPAELRPSAVCVCVCGRTHGERVCKRISTGIPLAMCASWRISHLRTFASG